jgi:hypothetical protein
MGTVTEELLRGYVLDGDAQAVRALLEPYTPAELKPLMKVLPRMRKEARDLLPQQWNKAQRMLSALAVATAYCVQTPAQAETWLRRAEAYQEYQRAVSDPAELLTSRRESAWIAELARRLGERMVRTVGMDYWEFVDRLAAAGGIELPLTTGRITGWIEYAAWGRRRVHGENQLSLLDWLRKQPRLQDHLTGIFEVDDRGAHFIVWSGGRRDSANEWPTAIATLAAEGAVDRAAIMEACAARLLRGDKPNSLRGHLALFEALKPTQAEVRKGYGTYASMAASAASTVAKMALRELRSLDNAEPFEPMDLAALSESVLVRPESGVAGAQLAWLDAALKRDRGTAAILLPCLGSAFAHPASAIQQRALKVLAKYVAVADSRTLDGLREAAQDLDAALRLDADRLLADPGAAPAPVDVPPLGLPEYLPAALPQLPGTPEELLTALAPLFTDGEVEALEVEQIMAAVAILAHRDRAALAAVFRPFADRQAQRHDFVSLRYSLARLPGAVCTLFYAVLGEDQRIERERKAPTEFAPPNALTLLRIRELADHLLTGRTVPALMATPTEASGAVDHAALAERAEAYRAAGIKPLPYDFEQARARVGGRPELREQLDALAEAEIVYREQARSTPRPRTVEVFGRFGLLAKLTLATPKIDVGLVLYPEFVNEGKPRFPHQHHYRSWNRDLQSSRWPTLLPHDPDVVAAHAIVGLRRLADNGPGETATIFPALAETAGTPGPATHLALAYALAADRLEHRIAAQDALLTFAARKLLLPGQFGRFAAELWLSNDIRGNRVVEGLARCEQAGAAAEVLGVAGEMISRLTRRPDTRGLADVLLLATRCAVATGTRGLEIPGLADLAALGKTKRVAVEARRLAEALRPAH